MLLARRRALGFSYSGESYQRLAASTLGNSMITRRCCGQLPSSVVAAPPRTRNRPPNLAIVAGTWVVYSFYPSGLVISISATT